MKELSKNIETVLNEYVKNFQIGYFEAVLMYCEDTDSEVEAIAKKLTKPIKEKIELEVAKLNLIKTDTITIV